MSSEDKYARSVAKLVAGQLMAAEGLDSAQRSTLEILSDLLVRYIVEVGAQSHMYAELSHRTECSPTDVATALKNMGQTIPSLLHYTKKLDEDASLVQNVSQFPVAKALRLPQSFAACGEIPPHHIPAFLPAFPDPHTIVETAKFVQTAHTTTRSRQQQLTEQQHDGEKALLAMQAREHPENDALQHAKRYLDGAEHEEGAKEGGEVEEGNAFFAAPVWESNHQNGAAAAAADGAAAAVNVEWVAVEDDRSGGAVAPIHLESFQLTGEKSRVGLATSGRLHVPDAYGEDGNVGEAPLLSEHRQRRRLGTSSESTRIRVRDILATRIEESDMAYAVDEDMDHELI